VSFKVEGRTKSVFYVATVGKIYREAIDYFQSHQQAPDELMARWVHELSQAGNRGFTEGFYNGRPDHLAYEYLDSKSHQGSTFLATLMTDAPAKDGLIGIQARNSFKVGETLDWMTPTATVSFTLTHMVNKHGFKVNEAQTNHQVWIEPPAAIAALPADELAWSMIRRKEMAPVAC
jgi:putative protease